MVQGLSQCMHALRTSYMEVAMRVAWCIKGFIGLGLFMLVKSELDLAAYDNSDWGSCIESKKSITGYVVKLRSALIS